MAGSGSTQSMRSMPHRTELLILFDQPCGLCVWVVHCFLRLDRHHRLSAASIQSSRSLLPHLSDAQALNSFHVVDPGATVYSAGAGLALVLRALPATAPIGMLLVRAPRVAEVIYRAVAGRRAALARFIPEAAKARARQEVRAVAQSAGPPPCPDPGPTGKHADQTPAVETVGARNSDDGHNGPHPGLRVVLRLIGRHLRPNRGQALVALAMLVIAALIELLQPLATRWVLEALSRSESLRGPVLVLIASVICAALSQGGGQFLMFRVAEGVVFGTRSEVIRRILGLSVGEMNDREPGDLMARVVSDSSAVRQIALQSLVPTITGTVVLLGSLGMMIYLDWVLFLVTVAVMLVPCVALVCVMPKIRQSARRTQRNIGVLSNEMERALGTFTTVKAANAQDTAERAIGEPAREARNSGIRSARWTALASMTTALNVQTIFLVVLGVGGLRAQSGEMSLPTLIAFLLYATQLTSPLLQLTIAVSSFQSGRAAIERIAATEAFEQESDFDAEGIAAESVPGGAAGDKGPAASGPAVHFEHVSFRYPHTDAPTLTDVTLTVPRRGLTALVGPSGSGKSTMLRLIEGFYVIEDGVIRVADRVLGDWDLTKLRRHAAYVEQETPVLSGTIRENLTYGLDDSAVDDQTIWAMVDRVGLRDRVTSLEDAVQHRGNDLSGGERQRISIARALLRSPDLLLLDEVTSQLDAPTEADMRELISDISRSTPVIVVAHRLSTVVAADLIVVMQAGRIRSTGTHLELLESDGLYRMMVQQQQVDAQRGAVDGLLHSS